ncbi:MAG: hypothetical protein NTY04_01295, partial [Candidatus Staskawiczbacteria bacterium]|nr:hypothetical protein [Candidatus Staskawiczbacteria bacterium]
IESKRNIVIEIIGDREDFIKPVIDGMLKIGYKISIIAVAAKPLQSFERHIKAVMNDKDYMSAAYTQRDTLFYFYQKLDLGKMPPPDKNEEKIKNN